MTGQRAMVAVAATLTGSHAVLTVIRVAGGVLDAPSVLVRFLSDGARASAAAYASSIWRRQYEQGVPRSESGSQPLSARGHTAPHVSTLSPHRAHAPPWGAARTTRCGVTASLRQAINIGSSSRLLAPPSNGHRRLRRRNR